MSQLIMPVTQAVQAVIKIPGSKSMTNRALIMAALASGVSEISELLLSEDTYACIDALRALGVAITLDVDARVAMIAGCQGVFPNKKANIWCNAAGTVARFLLAACAVTSGEFYFDGSPQLCRRPIQQLIAALELMGARFLPEKVTNLPLTLQGNSSLHGGKINIDSDVSSQFLSALLMAAPLLRTSLTLQADQLVSRPFVDMTCAMMADFGVLVRRLAPNRYSVPVPQHYHARTYLIEPDFSLAANFFAAAAITAGSVAIQPVDIAKSKQGDIEFLLILRKMGCYVLENNTGLTVKGSAELSGINVDMRDCSDTFMALAAVAPFAKTVTTITNIGHTRVQESNRIQVMCGELKKLNIKVEEGDDWLRIYPSTPVSGTIDAHGDHRIAMAFAVIGLRVAVVIKDAQCVAKTCPEFFKLWDQLYN